MPGVRSTMPCRFCACSACISACTRMRSSMSSTSGAVLHQQVTSPAWRSTSAGWLARGGRSARTGVEPTASARRGMAGAYRRGPDRSPALRARRALLGLAALTAAKRTVSPGRSWPSFQQFGWPAPRPGRRSRPGWGRRAEDDRHVAGEVDGADGVGVVVDVGGVQAGLAPVGRAHSGLGPIRRTPVRLEL
jgi:hypothetical protein